MNSASPMLLTHGHADHRIQGPEDRWDLSVVIWPGRPSPQGWTPRVESNPPPRWLFAPNRPRRRRRLWDVAGRQRDVDKGPSRPLPAVSVARKRRLEALKAIAPSHVEQDVYGPS